MSFDTHDGHTNYDPEAEKKDREHTHHPAHSKVNHDGTATGSTLTSGLEDLPQIPKYVEPHRKPKIGDDVHYILSSGHHKGEHRSARVIKIWSDTCVQLTVFTDWLNDFEKDHPGANGSFWATSVTHDATREREGSWHWPED